MITFTVLFIYDHIAYMEVAITITWDCMITTYLESINETKLLLSSAPLWKEKFSRLGLYVFFVSLL